LDGQVDGIETILGSPSTNSVSLRMGQREWNSVFMFTGLIDDVRIYNQALSAAEIQAMYNSY